jgi:hypothetical protein
LLSNVHDFPTGVDAVRVDRRTTSAPSWPALVNWQRTRAKRRSSCFVIYDPYLGTALACEPVRAVKPPFAEHVFSPAAISFRGGDLQRGRSAGESCRGSNPPIVSRPCQPDFDQESEALAWAQQYLESHRDTLDHARESIGVVRETDFSSFNAVI